MIGSWRWVMALGHDWVMALGHGWVVGWLGGWVVVESWLGDG